MNRMFPAGCLSCVLFFGCSLAGGVTIEVVLPPLPQAWEEYPESPGYILSYMSSGYGRVELEVPPSAESVSIYLEKGSNSPLLLTPFFKEKRYSLCPAGALFPLHTTGRNLLPLSWEEGFLAELFCDLETTAVYKEHINSTRMSEVIKETGGGDPWGLDKDRIIQALRFHSFRQDQVSPMPTFSVDVFLQKGVYLWNNPFFSSVIRHLTSV